MDFKQTLNDSFKVLQLISNNKEIDLSKINFITPFIVTPLSAFLKENKGLKIVSPTDVNINSYLECISFPEGISVDKFDNLTEGKTYFPLFCFSNKEISSGEILEKFTLCLEKFVVPLKHKDLVYQPLDELIDNIREHAFSDNCFIHAQIYSNKYLALSIVDIGITIPENYSKAGFELEKDSEAFEYILSGISSTKDPTRGYGLNSNINIISEALGGSMTIVSGKSVIFKENGNNPEIFSLEDYNLNFEGTFINILFEIPDEKLNVNPYDFIGKKKAYNSVNLENH